MPPIIDPGYAQIDPPSTEASIPPTPPFWNRAVYDALETALGRDRISGIARNFLTDLATRFIKGENSDALRRDAHVIVSSAGLLGFVDLSNAAKDLELACADDRDIAASFAAAVSAKSAVLSCLTGLLSPET